MLRRIVCVALPIFPFVVACSGSSGSPTEIGGSGGNVGQSGGSSAQSGGSGNQSGGSGAQSGGTSSQGGSQSNGGSNSQGGSQAMGGNVPQTGGTPMGSGERQPLVAATARAVLRLVAATRAQGGAQTGGKASGGSSLGGAATGGKATGGAVSQGGASVGGWQRCHGWCGNRDWWSSWQLRERQQYDHLGEQLPHDCANLHLWHLDRRRSRSRSLRLRAQGRIHAFRSVFGRGNIYNHRTECHDLPREYGVAHVLRIADVHAGAHSATPPPRSKPASMSILTGA